jgi:RNA polymerase sigma factor (sigma-70 family)
VDEPQAVLLPDINSEKGEISSSVSDPACVERLFVEHNAALLRFISAKVGSEQEAREIAQEAYVHLLRLDQHEAVSYLRAFLFKTAANIAVDRLRQRRRRNHVTSMPEVDFAVFELTPERQISGEQAMTVMRLAVAQLPPKCRQAFLLRHSSGLSVDEIAELMQVGACMVRRYIARGLEHVRECLDNQGFEIERGAA